MDFQKLFGTGGLTLVGGSNTQGYQQGPGLGYYGAQDVYKAPAPTPSPRPTGVTPPPAGPNPADDYARAARETADAELSSLNSNYDYTKESLLSQWNGLGAQKDSALNSLNTALEGVKTTVGNQKTEAQDRTNNQIEQAGNTAHNTQKQNRNVLRALGILNSSAAGEMLSKPINQFDEVRGQLGMELQSRVKQLDDYLGQRVAEHQNAYNSVIQQFTQLADKIQTDMRFNDRQRADAIKSANAALSQRIAEIQQSAQQYQQQVEMQKQQYASAYSNLSANPYNPSYDPNQINQTAITTGGPAQGAGANIYDEQKKKQGGLLSGLFGF